jgi:hypothetical protein
MQRALSVQLSFSSLSLFFAFMSVYKKAANSTCEVPVVCESMARYLTENDRPANRTQTTSSHPVSISCILILLYLYTIYYYICYYIYIHLLYTSRHHHHHHVNEGLGMFPVP